MPNCELKVEYEGRIVTVPVGTKFSKAFGITGRNKLYCAKFLESIQFQDQLVSIVHFTDFLLGTDTITFYPNADGVDFDIPPDLKLINLKIITPVAVPQIRHLTIEINSAKDLIFSHIFFLPHSKNSIEDLEYFDTISSKWGDLRNVLKSTLTDAKKKLYGMSVGIMGEADILPELKPVSHFFDDISGTKIMIIIVSSFNFMTFRIGDKYVSLENVPRIPKDIILRIHEGKSTFNASERRIIKTCLNGGIPVHLLDSASVQIKIGRSRIMQSKDFDQIEIFFGDHEKIAGSVIEKLKSFKEDLKDHLFNTSPEAALRLIFWDPVINRILQHGSEGQKKVYLLEPEWETKSLFSEHTRQKIDHAVTFELGDKTYPMLFVEMGKEPFDLDNPHKDQSKLLGIVSQACIDLAYGLIAKKKKPEVARTCGIWIGGLRIQFLVAQAVVSELPDGKHEIHANISINPHWLFDLSQPQVTSRCPNVCCKASGNFEPMAYERIKKGNLDIGRYPFIVDDPSRDFEEKDLEPSVSAQQPTSSSTDVKTKLLTGEIDESALKILNFFLQYVKSRITVILSDESTVENDNREFRDKGVMGIFVESRYSSKSETPQKRQIRSASASEHVNSPLSKKSTKHENLDLFVMQKPFSKELEIILKLCMFPDCFPVLFDFEIISSDEEVLVQYEFEELKMIFDIESNSISPLILRDSPKNTLFGCLNFTIECLYGLYLLHEFFGLVHSDISINNIMFSDLTCTWKIIDFDQCLEVSESLKTPRTAGTHGFIAPEAQESGIFTKESDIYSLGKVFVILFDFLILRDICVNEEEGQVSEKVRAIGGQFRLIINRMIRSNPSERPSALQALDQLFILFENFSFLNEIPLYSSIRMLLRKNRENLNIASIQEKLEKIHVTSDVKRPKISEEKEQPFSSVQTIE